MYRSNDEQLFAWIERFEARSLDSARGTSSLFTPPPDDDESARLALAAGVDLRLCRLRAAFDLDPLSLAAVVCLASFDLAPQLRTLLRLAQRDAPRPWIEIGTVAELLGLPAARVPELLDRFAAAGALRKNGLAVVEPLPFDNPRVLVRVRLATRVAEFLTGRDVLPDWMRRVAPADVLSRSLVPAELAAQVTAHVRASLDEGRALVVEIVGQPGTGRRFFAAGLAHAVGRTLLVCDLSQQPADGLEQALAEVRRETRLHDLLVLLHHAIAIPPPVASEERSVPLPELAPPLVRLLEELDDVMLFTSEEPHPLLARHAPELARVQVPFPSPSQRATMMDDAITRSNATLDPAVDSYAVMRRYAFEPSRIDAAVRIAVARARLVAAPPVVTSEQLNDACRSQIRHDLQSLAVRVISSYKWEDLVIPVDVYYGLCEMVAYTRHAYHVYEQWGMGARHGLAQGLSALFSGPPGTGKTMCASVIARELDMELFRVDLSRVVSKWIGETEKNLGKVFDEAQRSNAIILFDEADSLFAKRTEVKSSVDRYANLEVNYLLQRMDAFGGVTILTTNFEDTIDTAFKRRITFRLHFEKPDAEARASLWAKAFPPSCDVAADFDPVALGERFALAGGGIRNAAVRAAFLASEADTPVNQACCMLAAEREAREMGVLVKSLGDDAAYGDESTLGSEAMRPPPAIDLPGRPKLVPITHPRRK